MRKQRESRKSKNQQRRFQHKNMNLDIQSVISTTNAHNFPKSLFYRYPLESLLGKKVTIEGTFSKTEIRCMKSHVNSRAINRKVILMLLNDISIIEPQYMENAFEHIWIVCDRDYLKTVKLQAGDKIRFVGYPYEYANNKIRNIGLKVIESEKI